VTRTILLHLAFWTAVWFFFVYFFSYNSEDRVYNFWISSLLLPLTMAASYFAVYFLIPRFLFERKYLKFALYSFYTLIFIAYFIVLIIYGCLIFLLDFNISIMPPMSKNFFFILILVNLVVGLVGFVTVLNHNFKTEHRNRELQSKILETQLQVKEQELHYLKMQIHPHFLFNTLNTIYGFALKQSQHTPEVILKLSNLLDYILYRVDKPKVALNEEVMHIREYMELEKIRFKDSLRVDMEVGEVDEQIQMAPMLLLPFVENAFKHGSIIDGFLQVRMKLEAEGERMDFRIRNTCLEEEAEERGGGIGLENIRKRLELHYAGNYTLQSNQEGNWYTAHLIIEKLEGGTQ